LHSTDGGPPYLNGRRSGSEISLRSVTRVVAVLRFIRFKLDEKEVINLSLKAFEMKYSYPLFDI